MRWVGHVAGMGELRSAYKILIGKREGRRSLQRPRHGKIVLKYILKRYSVSMWSRFSWLRIGSSGWLLLT
jgi:hypothetical protein